jgi:predicted site-specific integrase-resolvase
MNPQNIVFADPDYLLEEAAEILRVSVKTLRRERARGLLHCFPLGGRLRILDSEIRAYRERSINKANGRTP